VRRCCCCSCDFSIAVLVLARGFGFRVPIVPIINNIPMGRWRDDLCSCFSMGCCHAQCCLTFWCVCCALGQVLTRMELSWDGSPLDETNGGSRTTSTYRILFVLAILNVVVGNILLNIQDPSPRSYTISTSVEALNPYTGNIFSKTFFTHHLFVCVCGGHALESPHALQVSHPRRLRRLLPWFQE
jgi:hypothetical protein